MLTTLVIKKKNLRVLLCACPTTQPATFEGSAQTTTIFALRLSELAKMRDVFAEAPEGVKKLSDIAVGSAAK